MSLFYSRDRENEIMGDQLGSMHNPKPKPYYFSRTPSPQPQPLPLLALHLSNAKEHVFRPGEVVTGHVTLMAPVSITPTALEVTLWGKSLVWIRRDRSSQGKSSDYHHYRDNAPLFNMTWNLIPQPFPLLPGQYYTFPFTTQFPHTTTSSRAENYKDPQDSRWIVAPHVLPPSMETADRDFRTARYLGRNVHAEIPYPDNAKLGYGITARLISTTGLGGAPSLSATSPLIFRPWNPFASEIQGAGATCVVKYSAPFHLYSSLLSGIDAANLGFRKRLHDKFSSSTPRLDFDLALEMPDLLISGSEFRFRASFISTKATESVVHIPSVKFTIEKIELVEVTAFRAPRDWDAGHMIHMMPIICLELPRDRKVGEGQYRPSNRVTGWEENVDRERKIGLNALPGEGSVELVPLDQGIEEEGVRLGDMQAEEKLGEKKEGVMVQAKQAKQKYGEMWFSARIPGGKVSSFKSYAVMRDYRVKVKLRAEVGEKKFVHGVESYVRYLGGSAI